MSESTECHLNNNDILSNCLKIINAGGNQKQNTHRPSSHGWAYRVNRENEEAKEMAVISAPVDSAAYFDELLEGGH